MTIKQLSIFLENKKGRVNEVAKTLGNNGISMMAFTLTESVDFGILRILVRDTETAKTVLKDAHFAVKESDVICIECSDTPGALAAELQHLAENDVFIEYMYSFSNNQRAKIVICPTSIDKCLAALKDSGTTIITEF